MIYCIDDFYSFKLINWAFNKKSVCDSCTQINYIDNPWKHSSKSDLCSELWLDMKSSKGFLLSVRRVQILELCRSTQHVSIANIQISTKVLSHPQVRSRALAERRRLTFPVSACRAAKAAPTAGTTPPAWCRRMALCGSLWPPSRVCAWCWTLLAWWWSTTSGGTRWGGGGHQVCRFATGGVEFPGEEDLKVRSHYTDRFKHAFPVLVDSQSAFVQLWPCTCAQPTNTNTYGLCLET